MAAKTVLMISYVFPPAAYVGSHRTLKYCRYLRDHGWLASVITIASKNVTTLDERLGHQVPEDVEVLRTIDPDPAKWVSALASWWRSRRARRGAAPSSSGSAVTADTSPRGWVSRLKGFVLRALLESPDSHVLWVPVAFARAARVLLTRKVDVVYASSPPHSSHLAAFLAAKCFRKPYVLDFRDPWFVKGSTRPPGRSGGALLGMQTIVKRLVVSNACKVISVSAGERADLLAEFPDLDPRRFEVITNGYDPVDFECPGAGDSAHFTITHLGTVYSEVGREFFQALELLLDAHPELKHVLRVSLLGTVDPEYAGVVRRLVDDGIVVDHGFQPHREALMWARKSDVLLILVGGRYFLPSHMPAKVFEYLHIGKPILAVTQPGDLSELLARSGLGVSVPPHDVPRLAATILELCRKRRTDQCRPEPNAAYISQFDRRVLAARFASVLDDAAAHQSSGSVLEWMPPRS